MNAADSTIRSTKSPRGSLAARLTAWYAGSAFVLILAAIAFMYWALVSTLEREDDEFLAGKARVLMTMLRQAGENDRELREEIDRESAARPSGRLYLRVTDASGRSVVETAEMSRLLPAEMFPAEADLVSTRERAIEFRSTSGQSFRALAVQSPDESGRVVQVAMDRTAEEELLSVYRWYAGLTLTLALLGCAAAGFAIARARPAAVAKSFRPPAESAPARSTNESTRRPCPPSLRLWPARLTRCSIAWRIRFVAWSDFRRILRMNCERRSTIFAARWRSRSASRARPNSIARSFRPAWKNLAGSPT